jgi:hypothetical protein
MDEETTLQKFNQGAYTDVLKSMKDISEGK